MLNLSPLLAQFDVISLLVGHGMDNKFKNYVGVFYSLAILYGFYAYK